MSPRRVRSVAVLAFLLAVTTGCGGRVPSKVVSEVEKLVAGRAARQGAKHMTPAPKPPPPKPLPTRAPRTKPPRGGEKGEWWESSRDESFQQGAEAAIAPAGSGKDKAKDKDEGWFGRAVSNSWLWIVAGVVCSLILAACRKQERVAKPQGE